MDSSSIGGRSGRHRHPRQFIVGEPCVRARLTARIRCVLLRFLRVIRVPGLSVANSPERIHAPVRLRRQYGLHDLLRFAPGRGTDRPLAGGIQRHHVVEPVLAPVARSATWHRGRRAPSRRRGVPTAAAGRPQAAAPWVSTGEPSRLRAGPGEDTRHVVQLAAPGEPGPRGRHRSGCRRDRSCRFTRPGSATFANGFGAQGEPAYRRPLRLLSSRSRWPRWTRRPSSCRCIRSRNSRRASLTRHFTVPTGTSSSAAASA